VNRILATLASAILVCAPGLQAQQPAKIPLVVKCQCDDPNSRLFETAVRDAVAASPRYYEVHAEREDKTAYYRLVLVAVDADPAPVVVSVVVLHGDLFMTSAVRVCGTSKLAWCASSVLSVADHAIQNQ
jgi:hypothetical protein